MKIKKIRFSLLFFSLILIVAGIITIPKIRRVLAFQKAMKMTNIEHSFLNMNKYLPSKNIPKSSNPFVFPKIKNIILPLEFQYEEATFNTREYIDSSYTQGLLVLQNGKIIYENYWRKQRAETQHIAWSMSKSFVSALFGIAIEEGYITNIQQTVEEYLPELKGSGYEGVKIKDVLQMASGIKFDETYSDPDSDINKFWRKYVLGKPQMKFIKKMKRYRPPGTYNEYVSINTDILAMIITKATGQKFADYLHEKIFEPLGNEFDAYWLTDGTGVELAHGGLAICLRDVAKFGQLYLKKGNWNGKQIVPLSWVIASTQSTEEYLQVGSKNSSDPNIGYGYQWWLIDGDEEEIFAIGVFNQHIYINPTTNTVIVKNSANQNYYNSTNPFASSSVHLELYRKIAHSRE